MKLKTGTPVDGRLENEQYIRPKKRNKTLFKRQNEPIRKKMRVFRSYFFGDVFADGSGFFGSEQGRRGGVGYSRTETETII